MVVHVCKLMIQAGGMRVGGEVTKKHISMGCYEIFCARLLVSLSSTHCSSKVSQPAKKKRTIFLSRRRRRQRVSSLGRIMHESRKMYCFFGNLLTLSPFAFPLSWCDSKSMNNKKLQFIHFRETQIDNKEEEKLTQKI
jgi:hypothetical protein